MSKPKQVWALMCYGHDSGDCYGVTDDPKMAEKWKQVDSEFTAVPFATNAIQVPQYAKKKWKELINV